MATAVPADRRYGTGSVSGPVGHVDASEGEGVGGGADPGEGIPGLEPSPRRRFVLLGVLALLLGALLATILVPRSLAVGETVLGEPYAVRVTPGVLVPTARVELAGTSREVRGERWPGAASASVVRLAGRHTVIVGSTPLAADSVRVSTTDRGVFEARVHLVGWHQVHVTVVDAPVTVTEVVAIGSEGQILDVMEPSGPIELEPTG